MLDFNSPSSPIGSDAREKASRAEMRAAMHLVIDKAVQRGWLECELAMAMADVAEEHVIALAKRKLPSLYVVSDAVA